MRRSLPRDESDAFEHVHPSLRHFSNARESMARKGRDFPVDNLEINKTDSLKPNLRIILSAKNGIGTRSEPFVTVRIHNLF